MTYTIKHTKQIISLLLMLCIGISAYGQNFFVNPAMGNDNNNGLSKKQAFRTIQQAQRAVRQNIEKMQSDINVYLCSGDYYLEKPLMFDNSDGGKAAFFVNYKAEKNATVNLHGGIQLKNWTLHDKEKNIFKTTIPGAQDTRQLFVNGIRAHRARSVGNENYNITADSTGHITNNTGMFAWKNHANIECVYREIWTAPRCGIETITKQNDSTLRIKMKQPGWRNARNKGITSTRTPWYFENAYELLDEEGEWYLDKTGAIGGEAFTIYYKPRKGENMSKALAIVPIAEKLIVVNGTSANNRVQNLRFENINFSYTTWLRPNTNMGHSDAQNNVLRETRSGHGESMADGAAMSLKYAENIHVENCSFTKLGAAGINMHAGCKKININKSYFYDLSATAIQMGDYNNWKELSSENSHKPTDENVILSDNIVSNNHIENCAIEYRSATGIAAAFPKNLRIHQNTVMHLPYSGLHIGWAWTTVPETVMQNNFITNNHIQNVMIELADGGAIYTLGPNTKNEWSYINNNYMYRVMWGQCVYMDNGSSFYKIDNNVYKDGNDYNVKINSGSHDIHVKGIYSNKKQDLVGNTGCYNYSIDSTQIFAKENKKSVENIRKNAGAWQYHTTAWQKYADINYYQAEHAEVRGNIFTIAGIGTKVFGYYGMGYLSGFDRPNGGTASFKINKTTKGMHNLIFRYAAGENTNEIVHIYVNKKLIDIAQLKKTNYNEWSNLKIAAKLKKGINEVIIETKKASPDYLYFDQLSVIAIEN